MVRKILDVETTIYQKGHPFSDCNKLCLVGIRTGDTNRIYDVEYTNHPYAAVLRDIYDELVTCTELVVFNAKNELNWLARYGIQVPDSCHIFDAQLAEFLLSNQQQRYPALDNVSTRCGGPGKIDVVKQDYWNQGIDTPDIPADVLFRYLERDLIETDRVARYQENELVIQGKIALFRLQCQDVRVLAQMEQNGIKFDLERMEREGDLLQDTIENLEQQLGDYTNDFSFNWDSGDHLSALLYGGIAKAKIKKPYLHTYKSGPKRGYTETRYHHEEVVQTYERLVQPLPRSELKKSTESAGYWSTDEGTLRQLKCPNKTIKQLINLLLERSDVHKLLSTYYRGIPDLYDKMDWQDGLCHGQLNQCVVVTGRLSASKPNQQNLDPRAQSCIVSRF